MRTACAAGGVLGVGAAVPLLGSLAPSERARLAGAPVEVEVGDMRPGELRTVAWRGKPVWILRRTPAMLDGLPALDDLLADPDSERAGYTPAFAHNTWRSREPEFLVVVGICTHLGCSPTAHLTPGNAPGVPADWPGGFLCPCHGSTFDLAGRVFRNQPAPDNLEVPPYRFVAPTRLVVGLDETGAA